jgi:hypothetical protein
MRVLLVIHENAVWSEAEPTLDRWASEVVDEAGGLICEVGAWALADYSTRILLLTSNLVMLGAKLTVMHLAGPGHLPKLRMQRNARPLSRSAATCSLREEENAATLATAISHTAQTLVGERAPYELVLVVARLDLEEAVELRDRLAVQVEARSAVVTVNEEIGGPLERDVYAALAVVALRGVDVGRLELRTEDEPF